MKLSKKTSKLIEDGRGKLFTISTKSSNCILVRNNLNNYQTMKLTQTEVLKYLEKGVRGVMAIYTL